MIFYTLFPTLYIHLFGMEHHQIGVSQHAAMGLATPVGPSSKGVPQNTTTRTTPVWETPVQEAITYNGKRKEKKTKYIKYWTYVLIKNSDNMATL